MKKEFFKLTKWRKITIIVLNIIFLIFAGNYYNFTLPIWIRFDLFQYLFPPSFITFLTLTDFGDAHLVTPMAYIISLIINIIYTYFVVILLANLIKYIKNKIFS